MSLLHTIANAARGSRPRVQRLVDTRVAWPPDTVVTPHDISVGGRSLTRLARERGTPSVLIVPGTNASTADHHVTLIVTRVVGRVEGSRNRRVQLTVDCALDQIARTCAHARLLTSPQADARTAVKVVSSQDSVNGLQTRLPVDSSPGDLLLLMCHGVVAMNQARKAPSSPVTDDDDAGGWRCMK